MPKFALFTRSLSDKKSEKNVSIIFDTVKNSLNGDYPLIIEGKDIEEAVEIAKNLVSGLGAEPWRYYLGEVTFAKERYHENIVSDLFSTCSFIQLEQKKEDA